jgi:hypothetical protein
MAERKSGPVKPPVIDLKAREASEMEAAHPRSASPPPPARLNVRRRPAPTRPSRGKLRH